MMMGIVAGQMRGAATPTGDAQLIALTTIATNEWTLTEAGKLASVNAGATLDVWHKVRAAAQKSTGKWCYEALIEGPGAWAIGIAVGGTTTSSSVGGTDNAGDGGRLQYFSDGRKRQGGLYEAYGAAFTVGDRVGIAFDATARTLTAYKNGVSQGVMYSGIAAGAFEPHLCVFGRGTAVRIPDVAVHLPAGYSPWPAT